MDKHQILRLICKDNEHARIFLGALLDYVHLLDDLYDRDNEVTSERIAVVSAVFIQQISFNPFYLQHKKAFYPLVVQAWNAWVDSTEWEAAKSKTLQRDSDVLKGFYHEIFYQAAFILGGWNHLRVVTPKVREYDHDHKLKEEAQ